MKQLITTLLLAMFLAACATTEEGEQEDPFELYGFEEDDGEFCIPMSRIDRTRILSNRVIVFEMKGGDSYINILPSVCPGLRPNRPIMYESRQAQLCHVDIIRLLDNSSVDFRPMGSCALGRFHSVPQGSPVIDDEG